MFGSLWKRLFGPRITPEAEEEQPSVPGYDPVQALRDRVRRDVAGGFYDDDAILTNANDIFEEELPRPLLRREASTALRQALADHRAAEKIWPDVTDCDRLDAAFAALEADGVIARQNFTCCRSCGGTEIWDEIEYAQDMGRAVHGYAFFHMEETEAAVDGRGLRLHHGACTQGEVAAIAIGHRVVDRLRAHGLSVSWSGSHDQRIRVALDWKKRRSVRMAEC